MTLQIFSTAFRNGSSIPTKYAYGEVQGGKNISPAFDWSGAPDETKSFALSIIDPHPVAKNWIHWFVINIPAAVTSISENASQTKTMPPGSKELYNSYGEIGYGGPCPPFGSGKHPYECEILALRVERMELSERATLSQFKSAIEGKIIARAKITGYYER